MRCIFERITAPLLAVTTARQLNINDIINSRNLRSHCPWTQPLIGLCIRAAANYDDVSDASGVVLARVSIGVAIGARGCVKAQPNV